MDDCVCACVPVQTHEVAPAGLLSVDRSVSMQTSGAFWASSPRLLSVSLGRVRWRSVLGGAVLHAGAGQRDCQCAFATRGQSYEKECVNYYSLSSRLNEERLT